MVDNESRTDRNTLLALLALAITTIAWSVLLTIGAVRLMQWVL